MRGAIVSIVALTAALINSSVSAQHCCNDKCRWEPKIKFLDDLFLLPCHSCYRDPYEERIETERHDFTQSTTTVGCRVFQVEAGYSYFYKDEHEEIEYAHTTPEMLARYGLTDDIEFRTRWNYAWRFEDEGEDQDAAQDLIWSIKLNVTDQCAFVPESALEIRSSIPTGGSAFTLGRVEVGLDYIYSWELIEGCELYGSTGYSPGGLGEFSLIPDEPETDRFVIWSQSVAIGIELTERMTMYNEWFGLYSTGLEDELSIGIYNVGIDYYITDDFVIDVRVGMGLTPDSDDFFTGIGGGYRF